MADYLIRLLDLYLFRPRRCGSRLGDDDYDHGCHDESLLGRKGTSVLILVLLLAGLAIGLAQPTSDDAVEEASAPPASKAAAASFVLKTPIYTEFDPDQIRFLGKGKHEVTLPWRLLASIRLSGRLKEQGTDAELAWEFVDVDGRALSLPKASLDEGTLYQALVAQGLTPREAWPVEQFKVDIGSLRHAWAQAGTEHSVLVWERSG